MVSLSVQPVEIEIFLVSLAGPNHTSAKPSSHISLAIFGCQVLVAIHQSYLQFLGTEPSSPL